MTPPDLPAAAAIECQSHNPLPPEGEAVFADRLAAFPAGCFAIGPEGAAEGYAIAHPWRLGTVPALGLAHLVLPAAPDCLWLHDVALRPERRGSGLIPALLVLLDRLARAHRLPALALAAVHGTGALWARHGFATAPVAAEAALAAYGATAQVMRRAVP